MNNNFFNKVNNFTFKNIKDTLKYYYIDPNVKYLKTNSTSYVNNIKNDFNNTNVNSIINPIVSSYKIKNNSYNILTPHKINLYSNKKYENKVNFIFTLLLAVVSFFLIKYINL